jgi:hypothetical protein
MRGALTPPRAAHLMWRCFSKLTEARTAFPHQCCLYAHTDKLRNEIRVGVASKSLDRRYHGGMGYMMDAAMRGSGSLIFVASVDPMLCGTAELEMIWRGRRVLTYNNVGKLKPPLVRLDLVHEGDTPNFDGLEDGHGQ